MTRMSARSLLRRVRIGAIALCALVVMLAAASASVSEAQGGPRVPTTTPQSAQVAPPLRGNALVARAQAQGTVKVIVWLNAPFVAEGTLAQREGQQIAASAAVQNQRAQIATLKGTLIRQLTGHDLRVTANWESLPGLAVTTDARGLQALLSSPLVSAVYEDVAYPPTMGYTLPLINASTPGTGAWAQGVDGTGFAVAVLDTGALSSHEFLAGQVVREFCYSTEGASSASFCPGAVNFAAGPGTANPFARCVGLAGDPALCEHGTHVSGTIAGNYGFYDAPSLIQPIHMGGVAKGADLIIGQVFSYVYNCGGGNPCVSAWNSDIISALDYIYTTLASTGPARARTTLPPST